MIHIQISSSQFVYWYTFASLEQGRLLKQKCIALFILKVSAAIQALATVTLVGAGEASSIFYGN